MNTDPMPWVDELGGRYFYPLTFQPRTITYAPRPEYEQDELDTDPSTR